MELYIVTVGFASEGPSSQWVFSDSRNAEDKYTQACVLSDDDSRWDTQYDYVILMGPFSFGEDLLGVPVMRQYDAAASRIIRMRQRRSMMKSAPIPGKGGSTKPAVPHPGLKKL